MSRRGTGRARSPSGSYQLEKFVKHTVPDLLARTELKELFRVLDYSTYGGAPLLGVKGVSIICHGASPPNAIKNAIRVAVQSVEADLSKHIGAEFAQREAAAQT